MSIGNGIAGKGVEFKQVLFRFQIKRQKKLRWEIVGVVVALSRAINIRRIGKRDMIGSK